MVQAIMDTLTSIVTSFGGVLSKVFTSITSIFYDATANELTFLGIILLVGVGASLVYWGFKLIQGLLSKVGGKK